MIALVLLLLGLVTLSASSSSSYQHDAYFARLAADPDGALHRHWRDFVALCDALAFERGTIHFVPLGAMSFSQQHALLTRVRDAGWSASIDLVYVAQAKPLDAVMAYGQWCHCTVLALDTARDNATNYRRMRTVVDHRAGLDDPVGREITLPGAMREKETCDESGDSYWEYADSEAVALKRRRVCHKSHGCDCVADVFGPLYVLRLDTTR